MVFLGDFLELYDGEVAPVIKIGRTVVHDRGYLSKYAYQYPILARAVGTSKASELLDMVLEMIPRPDLTLYLSAPLPVICARLVVRDGSCDDRRQAFIEAADAAAHERLGRSPGLKHMIIDTNRPKEDVLIDALRALSTSFSD